MEQRDLNALARKLLPALAVASGWCGIAYELLYSRLLTTYLGDMFHVNAAILTSFLLGIGIGAAVARRFSRWLWLIEFLIGVYALIVAGALFGYQDDLIRSLVPRVSGGPATTVAVAIAFTVLPACLTGFSVPLFSQSLRRMQRNDHEGSSFRRVYWLYNIGAGACVLVMEYGLLRWWGIRATLVSLSLVNLVSGLLLLRLKVPSAEPMRPVPTFGTASERPALFFVSALSGLYQLFLLKLTEILFGPFHENFALLLALSLIGIAAASYLVQKRRVSFDRLLQHGPVLTSLAFILFGPLIYTWATLNGAFGVTPLISEFIKVTILMAFAAGPTLVFGATVPALMQDRTSDDRAVGQLLATSSFGNCLGYLLAVLLVYQRLSYAWLALIFPAGLWVAGGAYRLKHRLALGRSSLVALLLLLAIPWSWPASLLQLSYREYIKAEVLNRALASVAGFEELRKFDENVKLIRTLGGDTEVVINGYRSLVSSHRDRTNLKELIVGAVPALFAQRRERALVLGVGTGITAGAAASLFEETTGVEINPAVSAALPKFSEHNLNLLQQPKFKLVLEDGLSFLATTDRRYDAIISTVTSPLYFSSSKLYTLEFFQLAKSRLAPGGVYAMWFDSRVTPEGAKIIFETIRQTFADCQLVYLSPVYSEVVCGTQPLFFHGLEEREWPMQLRTRINAERFKLATAEFLRLLVLPEHRIMMTRWNAPLNTFDRPQLEFLMAAASLNDVDLKSAWTPYRLANANLRATVGDPMPLSENRLAMRCLVFRAVGGVEYPDCPSPYGPSSQSLPLSYLENMVELLRDGEAPAGMLAIVEQIAGRGDIDRALSILAGMDKRFQGRVDYRELQATLRFEKDGNLADQELVELYRLAPLNQAVRRLAARACAQRGDAADALMHLAVLQRLGNIKPGDRQLAAALAGLPSPEHRTP